MLTHIVQARSSLLRRINRFGSAVTRTTMRSSLQPSAAGLSSPRNRAWLSAFAQHVVARAWTLKWWDGCVDVEVVGCTGSMVSFEPAVLSLSDMGCINQIRRIVSDAIAGGCAQQPQATLEALLGLLMRPVEAMEKRKGRDKVKRKWVPCSLDDSVDYLPQVRLDLDRAEKVEIGGGGGGARESAGGDGVRISLLCSDDFNVAAQLPPGYWIDTREECASGTHAWHEICFKVLRRVAECCARCGMVLSVFVFRNWKATSGDSRIK